MTGYFVIHHGKKTWGLACLRFALTFNSSKQERVASYSDLSRPATLKNLMTSNGTLYLSTTTFPQMGDVCEHTRRVAYTEANQV